MTLAPSSAAPTPLFRSLLQVRVWHLALLVLFVAVAIVNIQDQGSRDPAMVALAAGGFVLYGLLGWVGWHVVRRLEARLGAMRAAIVYLGAMALLFLVATALYTAIQVVSLVGHL